MGGSARYEGRSVDKGIEWPTIVLGLAIYAGWLLLTFHHARLPFWLTIVAGGWIIAWQGSLQHETIHGHPTCWRPVNAAIGAIPLALWLPYACYRRDHVAHHATEHVTDPERDPESRYVRGTASLRGRLALVAGRMQASLIGRLTFGPLILLAGFLAAEVGRARRQPYVAFRDWATHALGVAMVLAWLRFCGIDVGTYILCFVYPGMALTLLRSFAEHRAAPLKEHRVAIVERAGPFALLFLNNNLHAAHHRAPGLAWYALPGFYRRHRAEVLRDNGGLLYRGYGEIVRRYAWRAHDVLVHPDHTRLVSRG